MENRNILVLIVDDNPDDVRIYRRMLEHYGSHAWQITAVSSGGEGLKFLSRQAVDCVLLDYRLPDMDGLEFLAELNRQPKPLDFPILLLTGQGDEHVAVKAMKSGASDYLIKGSLEGNMLYHAVFHAIDRVFGQKEQQRYYEFLKILMNTIPNPLFFKDQEGLFSGCNKAFEDLVDKSRQQIIGCSGDDLFLPDLAAEFEEMEKILIRETVIQTRELTVPGADGQEMNMICYLAGFREIDSDHDKILGVLLDITSRKQTEARLQQTRVELEKTVDQLREANRQIIDQQKSVIEEERLKVLLQMAGATAHELNQPLTVLLGNIELLELDDYKPESIRNLIPEIKKATRRLSDTVKKIQTIDRYKTRKYDSNTEVVDIHDELRNDINRAMVKMADLSVRDELTGLYNRRYMNEVLENEFNRALRYGTKLSCILLDLDYFKQVNDNFGHACGDAVLLEFARRISGNKRQSDYAFRYGGEEFLLLLPQTDTGGACIVAENLLSLCRQNKYTFSRHSFVVTMSMGIAEREDCGALKPKDLLAFADKALYQAKADGRNCIRLFEEINKQAVPKELFQGPKGMAYIKGQLSQVLLKTKKTAVASIESLVQSIGSGQFDEIRQTQNIISFLCKKMHFPEKIVQSIKHAASLHNGFKVLLGDEILLKTGELTHEDRKRIQYLPYLQMELANQFDFFSEEKSILLYHNEKYDGTGYPEGLKGEEIPFGARVFAIARTLVSLTSDRPYRSRLSNEDAVSEMVRNAGTQFDTQLVMALLDTLVENGLFDVSQKFISEQKKILKVE